MATPKQSLGECMCFRLSNIVEIKFEAKEEEISFTIDDLSRALQNQFRIRQERTWNGRIATYDTLKRHSQIYNVITQQEETINSCLVARQLNDGGLICYSSAKDFNIYYPNTRKTETLKGVIGISELSNGKLLLRTEDSVFKYDRTSYDTKQIIIPSEYKLRTHLSSLDYHGFAHQLQDGKIVIVLANAYVIYDEQYNLL
jgi:nitrate reductase NapAB chaperone NapD